MKRTCCIILCLTALGLNPALSQQSPGPMPGPGPRPPSGTPDSPGFQSRLQNVIREASKPAPEPTLTKFDLDFPGGTPKELVAAIEKATGRPLNAIVPNELADTSLPALKMNSVDVAQLFQALEAVSRKTEHHQQYPGGSYSTYQTGYGFRTDGKASDDSIWHFYVDKPYFPEPSPPSQPLKVCRFYSLAPYLDHGLSVDDITTAIETGWKMLGYTTGGGGGGGAVGFHQESAPTISFHKETKLLIAVGDERKLETIDAVLKALPAAKVAKEAKAEDLEELDGVLKVLQKHNLSLFPPGAPPLTNPAGRPAEKSNSEK